MAAVFVGALCAALVGADPGFGVFVKKAPGALAWSTLIAAQGAIAGYGLLDAMNGYRRALSTSAGACFVLAFAALLGILFFVEPALFPLEGVSWPLTNHRRVVFIVSATVGFSGVGVAADIWRVAEDARTAILAPTIGGFFALRSDLRDRISFVGVQVGAAVLSTGLLRHTMMDGGYATASTFPAELVLAYGVYFTVLIAVVYFLAMTQLDYLAGAIVDEAMKDKPGITVDSIKARSDLRQTLGADASAVAELRESAAILAPLVSGLAAVVLPQH